MASDPYPFYIPSQGLYFLSSFSFLVYSLLWWLFCPLLIPTQLRFSASLLVFSIRLLYTLFSSILQSQSNFLSLPIPSILTLLPASLTLSPLHCLYSCHLSLPRSFLSLTLPFIAVSHSLLIRFLLPFFYPCPLRSHPFQHPFPTSSAFTHTISGPPLIERLPTTYSGLFVVH